MTKKWRRILPCLGLALVLAGCGAVLTIQSLIRERKARALGIDLPPAKAGREESRFPVRAFLTYYQYVIFGFIAFLAYVVLMYYLGYPISTLIFMPVITN